MYRIYFDLIGNGTFYVNLKVCQATFNWYYKGKLSITFKKDKISVNISTILSKNNSSGWTLGNGQFEFVKEK